MMQLPRIAVGTVQPDADQQVMTWALMNVLERSGLHVQSFFSQARFLSCDGALPITGSRRRHLDSWLMPPDVCSQLFRHSTQFADIGFVEGRYDAAHVGTQIGGSLDTLCQWLNLPRIVILDVAALENCCLPTMPRGVDGLLLDNVSSAPEMCRMQTSLESLYGVPVLGSLGPVSRLRAAARSLAAESSPTVELCEALGNALAPSLRFERLLEIATSRAFAEVAGSLFRPRTAEPLHVAVAFDDAFNGYFPDTLDVLESQGAIVSVFSPLSADCLPADTDVVYLGCGHPESYLNDLAANFCMKEALWNHVVSGGRVYAESAGLAYLCREIVMPCGRHWSMVGLLPALARRDPSPGPDRPVEVTLARGSWLFSANDRVRGYLGQRWIIHPDGCLTPLVSEAEHRHDLVGDYQIVGSRLRLDFAANPCFVGTFFQPRRSVSLDPVR